MAANPALRAESPTAFRRTQLLHAAGELIADRGGLSMNMSELALAAGVSRPVVYRHFANVDEVLAAVLEDFCDEFDRRLRRASQPDGGLESRIRARLEALCDLIEDQGAGGWLLLVGSLAVSPALAKLRSTRAQSLKTGWSRAIGRTTGTRRGELALIANVLTSVLNGAIEPWVAGDARRSDVIRVGVRAMSGILQAFREEPRT